MDDHAFEQALTYYRSQGAPADQQMLIALLREVQQAEGGALSPQMLKRISHACDIKPSLLTALICRIPTLRLQSAPHLLQMCQTCRLSRRLIAFVQREYPVGEGFELQLVPCMKNCKAGPSIRWDGVLYSHADEALLRSLLEKRCQE